MGDKIRFLISRRRSLVRVVEAQYVGCWDSFRVVETPVVAPCYVAAELPSSSLRVFGCVENCMSCRCRVVSHRAYHTSCRRVRRQAVET